MKARVSSQNVGDEKTNFLLLKENNIMSKILNAQQRRSIYKTMKTKRVFTNPLDEYHPHT